MKIQFDGNQGYQRDAIEAIVRLFDGQPLAQGEFEVHIKATQGDWIDELGVGNRLLIDEERIGRNVRAIQERFGLPKSPALAGMHFSVEMETGTGKTYVYLRTIYELWRRYGFLKFIIVVPSVAIREGVLKNIALTRSHFAELYGNIPVDAWIYDAGRISRLRQFAGANHLQLLIINIDAFNKKSNNVIHRAQDRLSGRRPIEFIQATCPFVIVDEPQNMESAQAKAAIDSLHPLATFRYSATHRDTYNLLYRLDPVQAYDLKLVKRIEVDSVLEEGSFNDPYIHVRSISAAKSKITAKLIIDVAGSQGPRRTTVGVSRNGDDLFLRSGRREHYRGYVVGVIDVGDQYISFSNGVRIGVGETHGALADEIMHAQIHQTVLRHLDKELRIHNDWPRDRRLKVLSLFFIDRVANYADRDGKIRAWFVESYTALASRPDYRALALPSVAEAHSGYFAQDRGRPKDSTGRSKSDDEAYALIMRDKERLLDPDEPLRFIFSHSALREGWDNPNVFQICTLNETKSELKKRQEIGRGLRLPVMADGERCFDPNIDILTVVANERYEEFAKRLQTEIREECGVAFGEGRIDNAHKKRDIPPKEGWHLDEDFRELWLRIRQKTRYSVRYETNRLIEQATAALVAMPAIEKSHIHTSRAALEMSDDGITTMLVSSGSPSSLEQPNHPIPNLIDYLQRKTELTRSTLAEILGRSGRLGEVARNPQQFLDRATAALRGALDSIIIAGIKYERIEGAEYEMRLFEHPAVVGYIDRMIAVKHSIYSHIPYDSEVEKRFAAEIDRREDIKLFVKLPGWFRVDTPVGSYNPDWAIVQQPEGETAKLYLVRETKGTKDEWQLRQSEKARIDCARAHFKALKVDFDVASAASQV